MNFDFYNNRGKIMEINQKIKLVSSMMFVYLWKEHQFSNGFSMADLMFSNI